MKFLVISDSHGDRQILVDVVKHWKNHVTAMFHCGDSELPGDDPLWAEFTGHVGGNCDFDHRYPATYSGQFQNETIFMTHGHLSNVRFDLTQLSLQAQAAKATLVFFGHTHVIGCERHNGMLFLNPGSISQPRGPVRVKTYAIVDATADAYDVTYYGRDHQRVDALHFTFKK